MIDFTSEDKIILESYKPMAKGIAKLFGSACEVVIHSLEQYAHSIIAIENQHNSGRNIGDPITDLALELITQFESERRFYEPYISTFPNGKRCRSLTVPIKNNEKLIGLLGINFNIDANFSDLVQGLLNQTLFENTDQTEIQTINDMMMKILDKNISTVMLDATIPNQEKNREIILTLNKIGFFNMKGSIDAIAERLKISVHTVYANLRKNVE
ncbi:MAG: helix-turn-helix transcriptional regulator [Treponemataceae bacterium]